MNDVTTKQATSGGPPRSGGMPPAAPPPAPPPAGDDDSVLTEAEVFDLLRIPEAQRTPEKLAGVPAGYVGGEKRYMRGVVLNWLAMGGERARPRMHRRG